MRIALVIAPCACTGSARIIIDPAPDFTIQRLAEVIAASGGHAFVGKATLPQVTRPTQSP